MKMNVRIKESVYYPQFGEVIRKSKGKFVVRWPNGDIGHYSTDIGKNTFEVEYSGHYCPYIPLQVRKVILD